MPYRLSAAAQADLEAIIDYTDEKLGAAATERLRDRFRRTFERTAGGLSAGHLRRDVPSRIELRFVVERPFVIAFDPRSREIVRILHGARDFSAIFGDE